MAYYLGIDGGGTKTRCALGDETSLLTSAMAGASNLVRFGEIQVRDALQDAIRQVCDTANIYPARILSVCIGAAGAARPEIAAKIRGFIVQLIPEIDPAHVEVVGDSLIALHAAFGDGPGVVAIAGTGSIAYGRNGLGDTARAGGWGFAISDEGSGYWVGRRAVSAILTALDRGFETALTAMVLRAWKLASIDELVQLANSSAPPDFARLFAVVLRAAEQGDVAARELLSDAGVTLAELAATVLRRLSCDPLESSTPAATPSMQSLPVAMSGSVFRQSPEVRRVFYNRLEAEFPGIEVCPDLAEPVEGALARARKLV